MFDDERGPIEHFSWAKFIIDGQEHSKVGSIKWGAGKDICMVGKKVTEWRERKGHLLKPDMITGVFDQRIDILIIGVGVHGSVQVSEEVKQFIIEGGINQIEIQPTPEACGTYNDLFHQGRNVALLAHGTC